MNGVPPAPPAGYRGRPAGPADIDAIHQLVAACERDLHGRADTDRGQVAAVFARDGFTPARDTVLVYDAAGQLAAWAWVNRRCDVDVHPAHRGRGLGGRLLDWVETRAAAAGAAQLTQTVSDHDAPAAALLTGRGYRPLVTSWLLQIRMDAEPAVPPPPPGVTVRPFARGDERAAYQLTEDAFDEWQQRRLPYPEWAAHTVERDTFAPAYSPLALAGDELVGAVITLDIPGSDEGYIDRLAVRRDHRNRGIARLLLRWTFAAVYRQGRHACTLWTHSDTGALSLYQRVGMTVRRSSTVYHTTLTG